MSMHASSTTPTAYVIRKEPNPTYPGAHLLLVGCPICGRTHTHGAPTGDTGPDYGHRAAHCSDSSRTAPSGYYIRERIGDHQHLQEETA